MKKLITLTVCLISLQLLNAQLTAIPDSNFEQILISYGLDTGAINGSVPTSHIDTLQFLYVSNGNISDLTGIEDFTSLKNLYCDDNNLTSLNLTQNDSLKYLVCTMNNLSNLYLPQNDSLLEVYCWDNNLTNIDVTNNPNLRMLYCSNNQISNIDLSQNLNLEYLYIDYNQLSSLNITTNSSLKWLNCYNNLITTLNTSNNPLLENLGCYNNQITELNVSLNQSLTQFLCFNNNLTCLNVQNGNNTNMTFGCFGNPNLSCIQVDNPSWSTTNWTQIDAAASFSTNCNNPCNTVGIEENFDPSEINIFPNPVTNLLTINLEKTASEIEINIFSISGKLMERKMYSHQKQITLNLSTYSQGIYIAKIKAENTVKTIKFNKL